MELFLTEWSRSYIVLALIEVPKGVSGGNSGTLYQYSNILASKLLSEFEILQVGQLLLKITNSDVFLKPSIYPNITSNSQNKRKTLI